MSVGHGRRALILFGAACGIVGCHSPAAPSYPTWASRATAAPTSSDKPDAFDVYVQIARDVESRAPQYVDRVRFTPGSRAAVSKLCSDALSRLANSLDQPCDFRFVAVPPDKPPPNQRGWRLLGRALAWRIETEVRLKQYDPAIRDLGTATKFGFDLTGGGASDVTLGLSVVDDSRRAFLPCLADLTAKQYNAVSSAVVAGLAARPKPDRAAEHERSSMLEAVQYVQDAYRSSDFAGLRRLLGPDGREAIDYLQGLHQDDDRKRPKYFEALAAEAEEDAKRQRDDVGVPEIGRAQYPTRNPRRPWRVFAKHFFHALVPAMALYDASLARTRLLALEANVRRDVKATGNPPPNLNGFSAEVAEDPFSGKPFVYAVAKDRFLLYSVGANGVDDGGNTDETFSSPDLTLERP